MCRILKHAMSELGKGKKADRARQISRDMAVTRAGFADRLRYGTGHDSVIGF
jgi:hypothetical protein